MIEKIGSYFQAIKASELFRYSGTYSFSFLINSLLPFLLLPLFTRFLTPTDYGQFALFSMAVNIAAVLIEFSAASFVSSTFFKISDDSKLRAEIAYSIFCLVFFLMVVFSLVLLIFQNFLVRYFSFTVVWCWAILATAGCQTVFALSNAILQINKKSRVFVYLQFLQLILSNTVALYLVIELSLGWRGRVLGQLSSMLLCAIVSLTFLFRSKLVRICKVDIGWILGVIRYGFPMLPHSLSVFLSISIDKLFLASFISLQSTGVYVLASQLGQMVFVVESAFHQAWSPWFFERIANGNNSVMQRIVSFTYIYFFLILIFAVVLGYSAPLFLDYFVSSSFHGASDVVLWIALAGAFSGMYKMVVGYLFYSGKLGRLSIITLSALILQSFFIFYLGSRFGAIGVGAAVALAGFLKFLFVWIASAHAVRMPWFSTLPVESGRIIK